MPSLHISQITKIFPATNGPKRALQDVSFEVPESAVVCLLGPNGSGKTTLLKIVSTLLSPNAGQVRLGDLDVHRQSRQAKRLIGFATSEDQSFYGRLSVRMNLWFYAQLYGLSQPQWAERLEKISRELDLVSFLDSPFRELSNGQKQRVLLARSLVHDPPVLLLDEPHQNLDPNFSIRLRDLLTEEWGKRQKKTILVSTHHLEDAQKISDRWVILSQGAVRFNGSIAEEKKSRPGLSIERFFQDLTQPLHAA